VFINEVQKHTKLNKGERRKFACYNKIQQKFNGGNPSLGHHDGLSSSYMPPYLQQ